MHALIPYPRHLKNTSGHFEPHLPLYIHLQDLSLYRLANRCQVYLKERGISAVLSANPRTDKAGIHLIINPILPQAESYLLVIEPDRIYVEGQSERGVFYGLMTLGQLIRQYHSRVPCLEIRDWPDFAHRGVSLDFSQGKIPRLETLKMLIAQFAELKFNQVQLRLSHSFAYEGHERVWRDASPLTPQDLIQLDQYCQEHYIELVPFQYALTQMHEWLSHSKYSQLAEITSAQAISPQAQLAKTQTLKPRQALCSMDPGSAKLMRDLFQQLIPHFQSPLFAIGCEMGAEFGAGRSQRLCQERGAGQVLLDYIQRLHDFARQNQRIPILSGELILSNPELISQWPRPCIVMNAGHTADHPFDEQGKIFAESGIPFYMCPGMANTHAIGGVDQKTFDNLRSAASAGRAHGASGYIIEDLGGQWQSIASKLPAFAYGAALSWCDEQNHDLPLAEMLNQQILLDPSAQAGECILQLGQIQGLLAGDSEQSLLYELLYQTDSALVDPRFQTLNPGQLLSIQKQLEALMLAFQRMQSRRSDFRLLQQELKLSAGLMQHACRLGSVCLQTKLGVSELSGEIRRSLALNLEPLVQDFKQVWAARNRSAGMEKSLAPLTLLLEKYQQ